MEDNLAHTYKRANSYKFLSQCYYLPNEELVEKVTNFALTEQFFAELQKYIPPVVTIDSLEIDFTKLFVGPFGLLAPPYGSVYLESKRIMGDSTIDVRKLYEDEDLEIIIKDAPDHIAMELEFMYYLIAKEIQSTNEKNLRDIQIYQQKQKAFLNSHLARWLPEFAKKVQENAQTGFYKRLTRLTDVFIRRDLKTCASLNNQQPYPIRG